MLLFFGAFIAAPGGALDILGMLISGILLIVVGVGLIIAGKIAYKYVPAAPVIDVEVRGAQMPGVPVVVSVPAADVPLDQQYPVAPVATVPVAAVAQPVPAYQPGAVAATAPYPGATAAPYPTPAPYPSTQHSYPTAPANPGTASNQPVYPPGATIPEIKGHDDALPSYDDATKAPV